jgi:hypothetical protein
MDMLIGFANDFIDFFNHLPEKSDSYWERIVIWLLITYLEAKTYMLEIAYEIASTLIQSVGLSEAINNSWQQVPSQFQSVFLYLKIPDALNMILSAFVTRFILGLMP